VATFHGNDTKSEYYNTPNYKTHKACLDVYRKASRNVMQIFKEYDPKFERASIDEAYFDVGSIIDKQIESGEWREILAAESGQIGSIVVKWKGLGVLAFDATVQESSGISFI
jgi:hypothetical protein